MPQDVFLNLSMNFLTMFVFFQLYFRYKVYVRSETVRHIILGVGFGLAQFLYRSFPIFIEGYREPIIIGGATFITAAVFGGGIAAFIAGCFPDLIGLAVRLIDPEGRPFMPGFLVFIWVTVAVVVLAFRFLKWRRWQIWLLLNFVFYVLLHFLTPNSASTSFAVYRMAIELGCGALIYYFVSYMHQAHVTQKQLERYALTDGLTGISNVRFFQEVFPKLFSAAQRGKIGLSLLVTDIDFLKRSTIRSVIRPETRCWSNMRACSGTTSGVRRLSRATAVRNFRSCSPMSTGSRRSKPPNGSMSWSGRMCSSKGTRRVP
ncbi:GGDEF-domain-containing protein [Paenibacillus mucilaginosus 3016]|uniref:GGDEF-domain-containing protein n=1 Tax=Paenibacillus mucilaginosus 3016 TaxID=1116391 RepID=H6NNB9_9BACL|nr:GGDEF-domain-containing protein [Paenibacillus mucilaginosus 3016]